MREERPRSGARAWVSEEGGRRVARERRRKSAGSGFIGIVGSGGGKRMRSARDLTDTLDISRN
jgi:hypothetical protein